MAADEKVPKTENVPSTNVPQLPPSVLPKPSWQSFLIVGAAMGLLLLGATWIAKYASKSNAEKLTNAFKLASSPSPETSASPDAKTAPKECKVVGADLEKQNFILRQRAQIVEYGDSHRTAAIEFGAFFYANVIIVGIFGFIAFISLLVITRTGLSSANGNVVAIFLLSSGIGLTYQGFFGVFQQKSNVDTNAALSVGYGQLTGEIDTYCTTGRLALLDPKDVFASIAKTSTPTLPPPGNSAPANLATVTPNIVQASSPMNLAPPPTPFFVELTPVEFILYVDWKMKGYRRFAIALDDKAVSAFTDPARLTGL
jgi:hypothetical protein